MVTNVALAGTMMALVGVKAFLLVHMPIMLLSASAGVWLSYVQHQFEYKF
jgi:acyl-lipid omega-6 desaturase (Delta-12 desaturase)